MANKQEILINVTPSETRIAVIEDSIVQELLLERTLTQGMVGHIFKGKVVRVLPGMQAAFIDIGLEKNGFLHAADIVNTNQPVSDLAETGPKPESAENRAIEALVRPGQSICVQVTRDPIADKGARLTTQLSIPSRNLVYLPGGSEIGISQQIDNPVQRSKLKSLVAACVAGHPVQGGFIIRTLAESARDQDIQHDIDFLTRQWRHIADNMKKAPSASLLHAELPLALRTIRELAADDLEKVQIDCQSGFERASEFARNFVPGVANKIHLYGGTQPLFEMYAVEEAIQDALKGRVMLDSGAYLVIDQTEAMTTIDVNTGAFVGQQDHADTLLKTNIEAAVEIAYQLRLRNSGGIIIIDFIDMNKTAHRKQVLTALQVALAKDRVLTRVTPISPLGLVELTRKRAHQSLAEIMCEPCAACDGQGRVKTVETVAYEILRKLSSANQKFKARAYTIVASPAVIELFNTRQAHNLLEMQKSLNRPIDLQVDQQLQQQQYDIALN